MEKQFNNIMECIAFQEAEAKKDFEKKHKVSIHEILEQFKNK
jgi:hypothetical protein